MLVIPISSDDRADDEPRAAKRLFEEELSAKPAILQYLRATCRKVREVGSRRA
jgi:hypothetical protein